MKKYEDPKFDVVEINVEDIITTSSEYVPDPDEGANVPL